jgi:hypothetical protein
MADAWEVEDMRIALRLDPNVDLLPCVSVDKESVKKVLLQLLTNILKEIS